MLERVAADGVAERVVDLVVEALADLGHHIETDRQREPRAAELPAGDANKVVHETADLLFHVMVGLVARRIPIQQVFAELARRFGTSGHAEKAARPRRDST